MLIREIGPFKRRGSCWRVRERYDIRLCTSDLASWFDIDGGELLWVQIHTRPAKDRLKVVDGSIAHLEVIGRDGDSEWVFVHSGWPRLNIPYPYYVEIVQ